MSVDKRVTLQETVAEFVSDGCSICISGMSAREPTCVCHEIIRQDKKDLTLITDSSIDTADLLIGAGVLAKAEFAYLWMGVIGTGLNFRRAQEEAIPRRIELEEYSNFTSGLRFMAGALGLPFLPTKSLLGSDILKVNNRIKVIDDPFGSGPLALVPAAQPDVAFVHVQRADVMGNCQIWGCMINDANVARAAKKTVVTCEEIVPTDDLRKIPNMTAIPYYCVDAVVQVPFGCHPQPVDGYYWMDVPFRRQFLMRAQTREGFLSWLDEWVYGMDDWTDYVEKVGHDRLSMLVKMERDNKRLPIIV